MVLICGQFDCLLYLQVEILQISEALKDVIWKWTQPTTVEVKSIKSSQSVKGVFSQRVQVAVVSQVEVLEQGETMEGGGLNVGDVVGVDPEDDGLRAEPARM